MNFQENVLNANDSTNPNYNKKILLDFYTPTCGPCRRMAPVLDQIKQEWDSTKDGELLIEKVDASTEEGSILSAELGVSAVPTFMVYKNGVKIGERLGLIQKNDLVGLLLATY